MSRTDEASPPAPREPAPERGGAFVPLVALLCGLGIAGSALGGDAAGWIWAVVAAGLPAALLAASRRGAGLVALVLALSLSATIVLVLSDTVGGLSSAGLALVGLWLVPLIATSLWGWRRS